MTPLTTFSPASTSSSSASLRVPILLTLLFWPTAICLLIFSPSVVDDVVGIAAIFAVYGLMLLGYGLVVEVNDRRHGRPLRRQRLSHVHLPHSRPFHVSG